jgi:hypothetical protein
VSGGWRLGDRLGCEPRSAVLVGCGELRSRILPRLEFFSGANRRTVFLIDPGDAPEPISLSAQRNRRKKRTPEIACPYGQPRERTPERGSQPFAVRAKGCLAGIPAGHPRPDAHSRGKRSGGIERQNPVSVGWGECNAPQHELHRPRWGALRLPQPTPSIRECAAHRFEVRSVLTPRFPSGSRPFGRFFRLFLCPVKERCLGASPRLNEVAPFESRTKYTPGLSNYLMTAPSLSNWRPTPMFPLDIHF